jgi:hypothetical protein
MKYSDGSLEMIAQSYEGQSLLVTSIVKRYRIVTHTKKKKKKKKNTIIQHSEDAMGQQQYHIKGPSQSKTTNAAEHRPTG